MASKKINQRKIQNRIRAKRLAVARFRTQLDSSQLTRRPRDPVEWVFLKRKGQLLPSEQMRVLPVAEVLKANRLLAGLSQAELAKRVGVTQQAIQRLERRKGCSPSIATICKVARRLGCDVQVNLVPRVPGSAKSLKGRV